jgi:hypothetical protein
MQMYDAAESGTDKKSFRTLLKLHLTVDAHQLLISNRKNIDSMQALQVKMRAFMRSLCLFETTVPQRLQCDLHEPRDNFVPWCCVVSDNSKVWSVFELENCRILMFFSSRQTHFGS